MENLMFRPVDYRIDETSRGVWRRFLRPTWGSYTEFTSHRRMFGLPFVHYTSGICPETGRRKTAKGVIAVGRVAIGVVAFGQVALGLIAIGQLGLGMLFGLGQGTTGVIAVGQLGIGLLFGLGQIATGVVAIGQFALGYVAIGQGAFGWYVLAQGGAGQYVWDADSTSPIAEKFFRSVIPWLRRPEAGL